MEKTIFVISQSSQFLVGHVDYLGEVFLHTRMQTPMLGIHRKQMGSKGSGMYRATLTRVSLAKSSTSITTLTMDDRCVTVALQLQLEDLQAFNKTRKGKSVEGKQDDVDLALETYHAELESLERYLQDLRLAKSIVRAVESDGEIIRIAREEEDRAIRDRRVACTLGGLGLPQKPKREDFMVLDPADKVLENLARMSGSVTLEKTGEVHRPARASSSKSTGKKHVSFQGDVKRQECVACREQKHDFDTLRASCGDVYCRECIVSLFLAALTDESLFPPRCCRQNIELEAAQDFLEPEIQEEYRLKEIEYSTPNRTYCTQPWCSRFLPSSAVTADVGTCLCGFQTCTICKAAAHTGDCPEDPATQDMLALAASYGWRQCSGCKRMVELAFGCNHIT